MTAQELLRWRRLATASYLALFSWMGLWLCRDGLPDWLGLAIGWLPLWLPLWGILRGRIYTFAWSNFIVIPYLGHAVVLAWINPEMRIAGFIEGLLALTTLLLTSYYTRFASRYRRHHGSAANALLGLDDDEPAPRP